MEVPPWTPWQSQTAGVTGQLADKTTPVSQIAHWSTRGLVN